MLEIGDRKVWIGYGGGWILGWEDFGGMGGWESGVVDGGRSYEGFDVCVEVCGVGVGRGYSIGV